MQPITTRRRKALIRTSLWTCVVATTLLPIARPWSLAAEPDRYATRSSHPLPRVEASAAGKIDIIRDPFDAAGSIADSDANAVPSFVVRAVVMGESPRALIEIGGVSQTIGIGSHIADATVTAIGSDGVTLDDGRLVRFAEHGQ